MSEGLLSILLASSIVEANFLNLEGDSLPISSPSSLPSHRWLLCTMLIQPFMESYSDILQNIRGFKRCSWVIQLSFWVLCDDIVFLDFAKQYKQNKWLLKQIMPIPRNIMYLSFINEKCKKYLREMPKILLRHIWFFESWYEWVLGFYFYVPFHTKTSPFIVEKQFGYRTIVYLTDSSVVKYNDCPSLCPVM